MRPEQMKAEMKFSNAARYRVPRVPGMYMLKTTTESGEMAVFAYLRVDDQLYAGAGDSVGAAASNVFALAKIPMSLDIASVLPTLDEVATLSETS